MQRSMVATPETDRNASSDNRAAVDKAICLLMSFGQHGAAGLGVSELARRADLSKSTAFRVLAMLERNGVVERVGKNYRLGMRLHELGRSVYAPDQDRVRDTLIPYLSDLYEATHETIHLASLHGTDVVYLAKLYGHRQVRSPSRIGGRVPAYATAVGKMLLAHDAESLEQTLDSGLVAFTGSTVRTPDHLRRQLEDVRQVGIASEQEEVLAGLSCLAAPIFGPHGRPVAAISISAPPQRMNTRAMEPVLRRVAGTASRALARTRLARSA